MKSNKESHKMNNFNVNMSINLIIILKWNKTITKLP